MLNFYSCGCTSRGDVHILSKCEEHGGFIVALQKDQVNKVRCFTSDCGIRIRHQNLQDVTAACVEKEIRFDLICSYPEHGAFYAHNALLEDGWRRKINPVMGDLYTLLKNKGHLLFVVEQTLLARVLYDCIMAGFHLNSITIVSSTVMMEKHHEQTPENYIYKFAVLFSKSGTDFTLPEYSRFSELADLLSELEPKRLLETSCIHTPFLKIATKTLGVCENYNRYVELKRKLCSNSTS